MTTHPQAQPLPGTVSATPPGPGGASFVQPMPGPVSVAQSIAATTPARPIDPEFAPKSTGASRGSRIVLGLSLLAATAGVSFALGHMTVEDAGGAFTAPIAAGTMSVALDVNEVALTEASGDVGRDGPPAGAPPAE